MAEPPYNIAVFGSWTCDAPIESFLQAKRIGEIVTAKGHRVITGGGTGVAEWAMYGALRQIDTITDKLFSNIAI